MRTECKCHGLSGSCTLRTCWKKMPHFREVGDRLLERFNGASKVMGGNDGKTLIPVGQNIKPPDKQDLIYSDESPDFCLANRKTGSLGTRGRMCNSTAMDISGCDLLCCERGYSEESVVIEENCLCRFHWCCVVQCQKCSVQKELSLCHWWTNEVRSTAVNMTWLIILLILLILHLEVFALVWFVLKKDRVWTFMANTFWYCSTKCCYLVPWNSKRNKKCCQRFKRYRKWMHPHRNNRKWFK